MHKVFAIFVLIFAVAVAGCGETPTDVNNHKPKPDREEGTVEVLHCYGKSAKNESNDATCWVKFDDGMVCLRSLGVHSVAYSPCYGGYAKIYQEKYGNSKSDHTS